MEYVDADFSDDCSSDSFDKNETDGSSQFNDSKYDTTLIGGTKYLGEYHHLKRDSSHR